MEGFATYAPALPYVARLTGEDRFVLVDIGCSGGIDPAWRTLGARLRAFGIDPNAVEIDRLRDAEHNDHIEYIEAFAGLADDHPFSVRRGTLGNCSRNPWTRLSAARSQELSRSESLSAVEKTEANLWQETNLATETIVVPDLLAAAGVMSVDFLKIDVDGEDFAVLNSFDNSLDSLGILGLGLEVNYFGSDSDTDHTFHNTDRFMKAAGFELFGLTVRNYSTRALPSRYQLTIAAQTEYGRAYQGDALYVRDLCSGAFDDFAAQLQPAKFVNLVAIFAAFGLPDCAAEVVDRFRTELSSACDTERLLDLLAAQAQEAALRPLSYREYVALFEAGDPQLFSRADVVPATVRRRARRLPDPLKRWLRRLVRAWRGFRAPL